MTAQPKIQSVGLPKSVGDNQNYQRRIMIKELHLMIFHLGILMLTGVGAIAANNEPGTEVFRPEPGKFPPLEKVHSYRGELIFVDHANRRGSIRVQGSGMFFRNDPHPFAMLPYGIVRYHGAPADLRDIPLGTVMHVHAFLPPDPKTSAVPVLPVDSGKQDANHNRGAGIFPAENHVLLLEDEPSHCQREGMTWKLKEVDLKNNEGMIIATRAPKQGGDGKATEEKLTFDAATRIWRGRECLGVEVGGQGGEPDAPHFGGFEGLPAAHAPPCLPDDEEGAPDHVHED